MGMFDTYFPKDHISCPVYGTPLNEWQGKEGLCILEKFNEESFVDSALPRQFEIYSNDCECNPMIGALCDSENGIWVKTQVVGFADDFKKIMSENLNLIKC